MIMKMNMILHDYSLYDKKINQIPPLEMTEMVLFSLNHLFINRSLFDLVILQTSLCMIVTLVREKKYLCW